MLASATACLMNWIVGGSCGGAPLPTAEKWCGILLSRYRFPLSVDGLTSTPSAAIYRLGLGLLIALVHIRVRVSSFISDTHTHLYIVYRLD